MAEQERKWKNLECSYDACPDRRYQMQLEKQLADKTEQYNQLHQRMEELQNLLDNKNDNEKEEIDKVVAENLALRKDLNKIKNKLSASERNTMIVQQERDQLRVDIKQREEQDLRTIQEITNIDKDVDQKRKELEKLKSLLYIKQKEQESLNEFKQEIRHDLNKMHGQLEQKKKEYRELKKEADSYAEELSHIRKHLVFRTRILAWQINRIKGLLRREKTQKARMLWVKVKEAYIRLNRAERRIVEPDFKELLTKLG